MSASVHDRAEGILDINSHNVLAVGSSFDPTLLAGDMTQENLDDDGRRLVALEVKVAFMSLQLAEMNATVNKMDDLLQQAKGMRWLLLGLVSFVPIITSVVGWFAFIKPALGLK